MAIDRSKEDIVMNCFNGMVIAMTLPIWLPAAVVVGVVWSPYFLYKGVKAVSKRCTKVDQEYVSQPN